MDRYLISGVIGLLIFQILFLLNNLGIIHLYENSSSSNFGNKQVIGKLVQKTSSVKRKGIDSIIWEDSDTHDPLYKLDSVLTLDHSTANLSLQGDVNLTIYENTLVVLEPLDETDDALRVRFHRGQMRSRNQQNYLISTGVWSFSAAKGSELSLRSLLNDRLELEVSEGAVNLIHKQTGEQRAVLEGKTFILDQHGLEEEREHEASLQIKNTPSRIYSHFFPVAVPVEFSGEATALHVLHPDKHEESFPVAGSRTLLGLNAGTYNLSLTAGDQRFSQNHILEIIPAPKLRYLSPLPRDRVEFGADRMFSWFALPGVESYELRMVSNNETLKTKSSISHLNFKAEKAGKFHWSVFAYDRQGYEIPPYYSLPIYFVPKPLAAPKLNSPMKAPEIRQPASDQKKEGASLPVRLFNQFASLILPAAWAEPVARPQAIVFTWQAVNGADHYVVEISSKADFLKPEVIANVPKTEFKWLDYQKQIYYWRVAGGAADGRMGLFSEVQSFDVSKLGSEVGSIPYFQAAEVKPPPKNEKPVEIEKKQEEAPKPAPTAVDEKKVAKKTTTRLSIGGSYWFVNQKSSEVDSIEFQGVALPSLSVLKTWNVGSKVLTTELNYHSLQWQPKDEDAWPYQEEFTATALDLNLHVSGWGIILSQLPVMERKALESIEPKTKTVYGLSYNWENAMSQKWDWASSVSLSTGESLLRPQWTNAFQYKMDQSYLQMDLDFATISGGDKDIEATWIRTGVRYGYEW